MSKERARRRTERETAAAAARDRNRRDVARARVRRDRRGRLAAALGLRRTRRPPSVLRTRRRKQDAFVLGLLLAVHIVIWLLTDSWGWRLTALGLSAMAWPLLTTLLFDRRATG